MDHYGLCKGIPDIQTQKETTMIATFCVLILTEKGNSMIQIKNSVK